MKFWIAMLLYIFADAFGTWCSTKWNMGFGRTHLVFASTAYISCTFFWLWGLTGSMSPGVAKACVMYPVAATIAGLAGALIAGERLDSRAWIGVALGLLSVGLISSSPKVN